MDGEVVISLSGVEVAFYMMDKGHVSLKEFLLHPFSSSILKSHVVLRDVQFEVNKGDCLGLLGLNGSGKSTLLRVISGIIRPSKGKVVTKGKIAPLLGLGVGLEAELTGRENIHLSCALLGLTKAETRSLMHEIIDFSGLGHQIDWAVKRYSTGMTSRLSFSIAMMNKPDILLIDEVLSVGDKGFQQKCLDKVMEIKSAGATIVYVSHHFEEVMGLCNKAALIHNGTLAHFGDVQEVGKSYQSLF
jgi:ABC-type polysaccharide/polyol phosphate transport system ATPase subunit